MSRIDHDFHQLSQANVIVDGRLVPVPGGVLIKNESGAVIGAVGVSGDTSDRDEECALAGISAADLAAQPGR